MRDARVLDKEPAMKFLLVREDTSYTPGPQSDPERSKEAVLSAQMMEKYQTDVLGPTIHYHPAYACSSIAGVVRKHFKTNKHVPSKVCALFTCLLSHMSTIGCRASDRFWIHGVKEIEQLYIPSRAVGHRRYAITLSVSLLTIHTSKKRSATADTIEKIRPSNGG